MSVYLSLSVCMYLSVCLSVYICIYVSLYILEYQAAAQTSTLGLWDLQPQYRAASRPSTPYLKRYWGFPQGLQLSSCRKILSLISIKAMYEFWWQSAQ